MLFFCVFQMVMSLEVTLEFIAKPGSNNTDIHWCFKMKHMTTYQSSMLDVDQHSCCESCEDDACYFGVTDGWPPLGLSKLDHVAEYGGFSAERKQDKKTAATNHRGSVKTRNHKR